VIVERVSIAAKPDTDGTVLVRNTIGKQWGVRADLRPSGTAPPREGEVWLLARQVRSAPDVLWLRIAHPAPPVVTGPRSGADPVTLSLLKALSDLGLVQDKTT
jgi:hypothetical protein